MSESEDVAGTVDVVDTLNQLCEALGNSQGRVGVGKDAFDSITAFVAQMDQQRTVKGQLFDAVFGFQIIPAIAFRQVAFLIGFFHHLEEQQKAEFVDVFLVRDAVVSQDVAEVQSLATMSLMFMGSMFVEWAFLPVVIVGCSGNWQKTRQECPSYKDKIIRQPSRCFRSVHQGCLRGCLRRLC